MNCWEEVSLSLPLWFTPQLRAGTLEQDVSVLSSGLAYTLFCFVFKFYFNFIYFYFWLCWDFVAARGLSLVAASGGYSLLRCTGFSLWWLLLLGVWALGTWASVVVARGLSSCGTWAQ